MKVTDHAPLMRAQAGNTRNDISADDVLSDARNDGITVLEEGARQLGVPLTEQQLAQFVQYRAELLAWNERVNLTAIVEPKAVMTRHFLDSLTMALAVPVAGRMANYRVLDVGSGAGLPGLALAIAFPRWQVTLLESIGKKTAFLRHATMALGLDDRVEVVTGRAEDLARDPAHRGSYDLAVARAVASLAVLAEYLLPFCRVGGQMIALKKGDLAEEIGAAAGALALLGGAPLVTLPVPALPDLGADRVVLVATKRRVTPLLYPRRAGLPAHVPLGTHDT